MKAEVLRDILAAISAQRGKAFELQGQATFMLDGGGSLVVVDKVRAAAMQEKHLELQSARGERYLCAPDAVVCVKVERSEEEGTGFV